MISSLCLVFDIKVIDLDVSFVYGISNINTAGFAH